MKKAKSSIVAVGAISALACTLAGFCFGGQVKTTQNDDSDFYGFKVIDYPYLSRNQKPQHEKLQQCRVFWTDRRKFPTEVAR
jgi:hypothetical protein